MMIPVYCTTTRRLGPPLSAMKAKYEALVPSPMGVEIVCIISFAVRCIMDCEFAAGNSPLRVVLRICECIASLKSLFSVVP